jgi:hypothetical protein
MSEYTVIGLWLDDEPFVAGVIEGSHAAVDTDPNLSGEVSRWAVMVAAADPDAAEVAALEQIQAE